MTRSPEDTQTTRKHQSSEDVVELNETLANALADLKNRERVPGTDLWLGVHSEIASERRSGADRAVGRTPLLWAAVVAVSVALAALTWLVLGARSSTAPIELGASELTSIPPASSPALREAFDRHQAEREPLLRALAESLGEYPEATRVEIVSNLRTIADAMGEIERSLRAVGPLEDEEQRLVALFDLELRVLRSLAGRLRASETAAASWDERP